MLIRRESDVPAAPVDMQGAQGVSMRLMIGRNDGAPNFAMRQFTVQPGGHTPRHAHNYEHEVLILHGTGTIEENGDHHTITAGDVLLVKPNVTHQFVNTGDTPLKFICLVPISFDCGEGELAPTPGS